MRDGSTTLAPFYRVTIERMCIREEPSTAAKIVGAVNAGAVLRVNALRTGTDGHRWLELAACDVQHLAKKSKDAWVLLDGAAAGLSQSTLLEPAAEAKLDCGENQVTVPWEEKLHPQSRGANRSVPRFVLIPPKAGWVGGLQALNVCVSANGIGAALSAPPRLASHPESAEKLVAEALNTTPVALGSASRGSCWLVPCTHREATPASKRPRAASSARLLRTA
jgi:hypothetical protein